MGLKERLKVLALLALEMKEGPKAKGSGASRSGSSEETDSPPGASERNRGCPHLVWLQGDRSWSPDNTVQFPEATWVGCFVTAQKEAHDLLPTLLASVTVGEGCEQCLPVRIWRSFSNLCYKEASLFPKSLLSFFPKKRIISPYMKKLLV